ncbi:MAG: GntR family transcriptional regulator [Roseateles depolymerans]|uniref:GntR family transcriptional regulator n=1 Tax=Roseateles depolymerans TaxID=76731 RepID=A0A2W5DUX9_9BURK|nr:MAG: GntR family transcriptional regulator [Roseateles depolymerans]
MDPSLELDLSAAPPGQRLSSLHAALRDAIASGRLAAGLRLPSSRELAARVGVSRNTAVAAYELLAAEGWLLARGSAGSYLADLPRATAHRPERAQIAPWADRALTTAATANSAPDHRPAPTHSFNTGVPDLSRFPFEVLRRLQTRALQAAARAPAVYAPAQGLQALRAALAGHASSSRAVACSADDVLVTAGAQQAFDLIARVLVTPGRTVAAVEDPGYLPLRAALRAAGARLAPVPVDREGLVVAALPRDARIVCVTPSHQFPLGVPLSLARRRELLNWAAQRQAVIIEDDYDGEFRFSGRPLDALQTLDRDGRVFYVGTLSKSMLPALRLGYLVAPAWAQPALLAAKQAADGGSPALTQAAVADFIAEGHLLRHVRRMRAEYAERRGVLEQLLRRHLGEAADIYPAIAGLHLAVGLPGDAAALARRARAVGVAVETLGRYRLDATDQCPAADADGLVLGLGLLTPARLPEAVRRLARAFGSR